jgi:hypothetical protein
MSRDDINEYASPLLLAGVASLLSMPVVYMATRPVMWLSSAQWVTWLLALIYLIAPFAVTFAVLYRCAWHDDRPRARRLLSIFVSSCVIVGIDLLLIGALGIAGGLITGLSHKMGGN